MKCIDCGAELHGMKCEYCGSEYASPGTIQATFDSEHTYGKLTVNNNSYDVYISNIEYEQVIPLDSGRDLCGRLVHLPVMTKRRFTLNER